MRALTVTSWILLLAIGAMVMHAVDIRGELGHRATGGFEQRLRSHAPETPDALKERREIADLVAQQRMAHAAEELTRLTLLQLWVGVAGTMLVAGSLFYSARATIAGFKTAKIAEDTLASQSRPNMLTSKIRIGVLNAVLTPAHDGHTELEHKAKNFGNGVAWVTDYRIGQKVIGMGDELKPDLDLEPAKKWPIPPGGDYGAIWTIGIGLTLSEPDRADIYAARKRLFIFGILQYHGDDGRRYCHQFVYVYRASDHSMVPFDHPFWQHT